MISEFVDDHEEAHAIPAGAALGFAIVATGNLGKAGVILAVFQQVWERKKRPKAAKTQDLANDIRREPHYFFAGIVIGAVVGIGARLVTGASLALPF